MFKGHFPPIKYFVIFIKIPQTTSTLLILIVKKGRQLALESKINEIDNRLKELGIEGLKYKVLSAISNFETTQNFINIQNHVDSGWLFRARKPVGHRRCWVASSIHGHNQQTALHSETYWHRYQSDLSVDAAQAYWF